MNRVVAQQELERQMGINAAEVEAVAAKAKRLNAFVAVPLAQRYAPFATRARELIAAGRFGPLSHIYVRINRPAPARYPAWDCAWMLDPAEARRITATFLMCGFSSIRKPVLLSGCCSTDLNPDTLDPAEREAVETLRATCERHQRANGPVMTRMTLHRV
jgi:hypothetical protein